MDKEKVIYGRSTMDDTELSDMEESSMENIPKRRKYNTQDKRNELLRLAVSYLINEKAADEADVHSASWASQYRKLDPQQQLFANMTIHEVLYRGALGQLNENSHLSLIPSLGTGLEREHRSTSCSSISPSNYNARATTPFFNLTPSPVSYEDNPREIPSPDSTSLTSVNNVGQSDICKSNEFDNQI